MNQLQTAAKSLIEQELGKHFKTYQLVNKSLILGIDGECNFDVLIKKVPYRRVGLIFDDVIKLLLMNESVVLIKLDYADPNFPAKFIKELKYKNMRTVTTPFIVQE